MSYDEEAKRLRDIISDERQRKEVLGSTGEEAQKWLDLMQLVCYRRAYADFENAQTLALDPATSLWNTPKHLKLYDRPCTR